MFPAYAFFRCLFQLFPKKETIEIKKVCLKFTKDFCTIRSRVQVRIWTQGNVVIISTCKKICSGESVPNSSKLEDLIYFVEFRPTKSKVRSVSTWGQDQFALEKKWSLGIENLVFDGNPTQKRKTASFPYRPFHLFLYSLL